MARPAAATRMKFLPYEWEGHADQLEKLVNDVKASLVYKKGVSFPAAWESLFEFPPKMIKETSLSIVEQPFSGMGLQTACAIPANRMVTWYGGIVHSSDTYPYESTSVFKVQKGRESLFIESTPTCCTQGSFVNHSHEPNCEAKSFIMDRTIILAIISLRAIQPREFLTIDYVPNDPEDYKSFFPVCMCGAKSCPDYAKFVQKLIEAPGRVVAVLPGPLPLIPPRK